MKLSRISAIARKQFITLRHDRRTLALMLIAPIMAMWIFGFAFGSGTKHVPVAVVNKDRGQMAQNIIDNLDHEILDIEYSYDEGQSKEEVRDGKKTAVIIFPEDFSMSLEQRPQIFIDTTNQQMAEAVFSQVTISFQKTAKSMGEGSNIAFESLFAYPKAKNATYMDTFVPGVMVFAITVFTTLLTLLAFVGERTSGTLDRLRVTPASEGEIVLGYELAFGIIATIQGSLLLVLAILFYNILVVGSLLLAGLIVILVAIDAQAIGIVISSAAKRESQAIQFIPFVIFPVFLLSGVFVPLQNLPDWLRPFSYFLPATWGIEGLRNVLLKGWGLENVLPQILALTAFAVVFTIIAVLELKHTKA